MEYEDEDEPTPSKKPVPRHTQVEKRLSPSPAKRARLPEKIQISQSTPSKTAAGQLSKLSLKPRSHTRERDSKTPGMIDLTED